jgi:hypothetical protein
MNEIKQYDGYWTGYLLRFGDPVPEADGMVFAPNADYGIGMLYTQGPVTAITGEHAVGQLVHIKKDTIGVHVTMEIDEIPPGVAALKESLVWAYRFDPTQVMYVMKDNPLTGDKVKTLAVFPLLEVHYSFRGFSNGIQTPAAAIDRPAGRRSRVVVRRRPTGGHSTGDPTGPQSAGRGESATDVGEGSH